MFGIFYGGWVAVLPAVVMDYFGGRNVSGLIGILYTSVAFGTLVGPSAAGFAFDFSHSYTAPILVSAAANIVAVIIVATIGDRRPAASDQARRPIDGNLHRLFTSSREDRGHHCSD